MAICSRRIPLDGCTLLFLAEFWIRDSDSSSLLCPLLHVSISFSFDFSSSYISARSFVARIFARIVKRQPFESINSKALLFAAFAINERLEGFRKFFFLLRAFYYLSDFPNFLNFLRKKLFSIPRSIIATLFDQISDDVRIHGYIRKMFIWKPRLSDGIVGRGFDWRISSIGRHKVNYWIQDQSRVSKTDARSKSYPSHAAPPLTCFRQRWSSVGPFKLFSPRYSTSRHRVSRAWTRTSIDRSIFSSIAAIVDALRERTPRRHSAYPPAPRNGGFPFHPMLFRLVMSGCCCCWVRPCPRLRTRAEPFRDRYRDVFNGEIGFRSRLRGFRTRPRAIVDERLSFSVPVDLSVLRRVCLRGNNRESCEG